MDFYTNDTKKNIEVGNKMKEYDYLIVGAGLYGSVFANLAKSNGKKCLIIDKRSHLGGNIYCDDIEGIHVHKYGAHIFHTSNKNVWDYVNSFVIFNRYTNCPVANYHGKLFNLPFNMNTFYQMWGVTTPDAAAEKIEKQKKESGIVDPKNLEEQAISLIGKDIYEVLVKEYTEKQWGRDCRDLPAFIIKRLPVRFTFDNNYFNDAYQGIPIGGYNKLIEGLLDGIETKLNTDYFENREYWNNVADKIVFTGKIDEFYGYKFGKLEYRTVRFETETLNISNYQGNAVVNYTSHEQPYTRVIEHKHFEPENPSYKNQITVISKEYSTEWKEGMEPFYPVNDEKNTQVYGLYKKLAEEEKNVLFGGRLAEYKYYDMDDIIEKVMKDYENVKDN
jgi:UDP-galactopyranose mutase